MVTSVRTVCLSLPLSVEERGKLWFSLSLNYAGFRVFTKLFVLPFAKKVPQIIFCFPSVTCSSYFWLLCSVFKVQFLTPVEVRSKHSHLCKRLNLNSRDYLGRKNLGPVADGTRQVAREYVLRSKTFPAGGIHFRRGCQIPFGAPSKSQI